MINFYSAWKFGKVSQYVRAEGLSKSSLISILKTIKTCATAHSRLYVFETSYPTNGRQKKIGQISGEEELFIRLTLPSLLELNMNCSYFPKENVTSSEAILSLLHQYLSTLLLGRVFVMVSCKWRNNGIWSGFRLYIEKITIMTIDWSSTFPFKRRLFLK